MKAGNAIAGFVLVILLVPAGCLLPGIQCASDEECADRWGTGARCVEIEGEDASLCERPCESDEECDGRSCVDSRCVEPTDDAGPTADAGDAGGPGDDVVIVTFEASTYAVAAGSEVQLSWVTQRATSCSLDDGTNEVTDLAASESDYTVTVSPPVTYTLRCEGTGEPAEDVLTIGPELTIETFTATPSATNAGDEVTFAWTVEGATACTISGASLAYDVPSAEVANGELLQALDEGGPYTLSCSHDGGSVQEEAAVSVASYATLPEATPSAVAVSQQVTLSWSLENAASQACEVSDGSGSVVDEDAVAAGFQRTVSASTTFTVSCDGNNPSAPLEETVYVPVLIEDVQPVDVVDYDATGTLVFTPSASATGCTVNGVDAASPFLTESLTASTVLELACQDGDGRTATVDVPVSVRPSIESFSGTLEKPASAVEVVLSWTVSANTSSCTVLADDQPLVGAIELTATTYRVTSGTGTAEYSLVCTSDPGAEVASASAVTVLWGGLTGANLSSANGVDVVTGDVNLLSFGGSSLADLATVREVGGTLLLQNADSLGTLNGLQALSNVLGDLTISGSDNLAAASLPGLTAVGGSMTISSNPQLLGVSMEALASIGGDLVISQNAALGSASIGSLVDVGGSLTVATTGLQSFTGFSGLTHVRGTSYSVSSNNALPCEDVQARYCLLATKPATYLNQNNSQADATCNATDPGC